VQLPQVDRLETEPAQAHQTALTQVFRPPHLRPDIRAVTRETALRRNMDAVERVQRLADQVLGVLRSVRVGGVDQIDTKLAQPSENGDRGIMVFRRSPDPLASDPHRPKAKTSDLKVTANLERAGRSRIRAHAQDPFSSGEGRRATTSKPKPTTYTRASTSTYSHTTR
jgi:hypothetical protein